MTSNCPYGNDHTDLLGVCSKCALDMNPSAEELFDV